MAIQNLEPICARWGRTLIDNGPESIADKENTITKALGVLAENGLYAMGVFLLSCHKKDYGTRILTQHLAGLWQELELCAVSADKSVMLGAIQKIAEDLPKLILARKVTEQTLVLARYHAKAEVTASGGQS